MGVSGNSGGAFSFHQSDSRNNEGLSQVKIQHALVIGVFFSCLQLFAEKGERIDPLRIGKEESVNAEGIKLKVFKDAQMRPIPTVGAAGYIVNPKTKERKGDVFIPYDLWFASQCLAMWDCKGGKIYLAQMTLNPPPTPDTRILMDAYNQWKESAKFADDGSQTEAWLAGFAKAELEEPVQLKAAATGVEIKAYPIKGALGSSKAVYVVSNTKNREQTYALLYETTNDKEPAKNAKKVIEQSVTSISFFKEKEGAETPKQMNAADSAKRKREWSGKYIQSRATVIDNLKNLKDWWYLETDNFIIASNITKRAAITNIQNMVEANRAVYLKLFPLLVPVDAVSVVRVFNKREDYLAYVPKRIEFSAGVWMPGKKELVISSTEDWAKGAKGAELMLGIIAHEGFHQYLHYAMAETETAPWFNEGTAEVFEHLKIKPGGRFEIDIPDYDYADLKELMRTPSANLQRLIGLSYEEFYDKARMNDNYRCAGAFMYFLYKGAQVMKGKESYAEIPGRYYKTLCETRDQGKAAEAAFQGIDMKALETDWKSFWDSKMLYNKSKSAEFKPVIDAPAQANGK